VLFFEQLRAMIHIAFDQQGTDFGEEAEAALEKSCPPATIFYSAHRCQGTFHADKVLQDKMEHLRGKVGLLHMLLTVMDDEPLVVIHLTHKQGYRFKITGIADNCQLHVLVVDTLARLPNTRLQDAAPYKDRMVKCLSDKDAPQNCSGTFASQFEMGNWAAYHYHNSLVSRERCYPNVWNEGVPADIHKFKGKERILMLNQSKISRGVNCCRMFAPLGASAQLEKVLTEAEVEDYLAQFAVASQEEKDEATKENRRVFQRLKEDQKFGFER